MSSIDSRAYGGSRQLRFTRIDATGPATKKHWLGGDELRSESAPNVYAGRGRVVELPATLEALTTEFRGLTSSACVIPGVPKSGLREFELTWAKGPPVDVAAGRIDRSLEQFEYAPTGLTFFTLDRDKIAGENKSPEQVVGELIAAVPGLAGVRWAVTWSASSNIATTDGTVLRGPSSFHLHTLVAAREVPKLAAHLKEALAAAGHVRYELSSDGKLLEKSTFDFSVYQANRVFYEAPPICGPGLVAFGRDVPMFVGGTEDVIDCAKLTPLTAAQEKEARDNRAKARALVEPQARDIRESRIKTETKRQRVANPRLSEAQAENRARAMFERQELHPGAEVIIIGDKGDEQTVTVAELLAAPETFDGALCLDPLEPEYRDRKVVGKFFANGDKAQGVPVIFSQAHGGCAYALERKLGTLVLREGKIDELTEEAVIEMAASGQFFNFAGSVAIVDQGRLVVCSGVALKHEIERRWAVRKYAASRGRPKAGEEKSLALVPAQLPDEVADRITKNGRLLSALPALRAVRTDPLLWADQRLVEASGYDDDSSIWFSITEDFDIPMHPTDEQVRQAVELLMRPLSGYRFGSQRDRSAALLAMLTAVVRPALPTAPAFLITAAMRGSGKTKLGMVIALLAGEVQIVDLTGDPSEAAKRIDAFLRGVGSVLLADNLITGEEFNRPEIASMLTETTKAIRPFGRNDGMVTVSTLRLVLGTANNPRVLGDAVRRVITVLLQAASATPHLECFEFDPVEMARSMRQEMVQAALILLRAGTGTPAGAVLGSFEEWGRFVGGALERVRAAGCDGFASFAEVLADTTGADPTGDALRVFLDAVQEAEKQREVWGTSGHGVTVARLQAMACDAFGRRDQIGTGNKAAVADALDQLSQATGFKIWTQSGVFNVQSAGKMLGSLSGTLFLRDGETWLASYPESGRPKAFTVRRSAR